MSLNWQINGIEKAMNVCDVADELDDMIHNILLESAKNIVDEAKSNLQNNTNINSGDLLTSIKVLFDDGQSIWVGSDLDYAGHIEFGRGPVFPLDPAGWLHWIDKATGKDVFAKKAKATEPSPFLQPAVELEASRFPELVTAEFETKVRNRT